MAELNSWDRDHVAHETKNIYYPALYGKNLPTPLLENAS